MAGAKNEKKNKLALNLASGMLRFVIDIAVYAVAIIAFVYITRYAYNFCYQIFGDASVNDALHAKTMTVVIEEDESLMDVARMLEDNDLILNRYSFYAKLKLEKVEPRAGQYDLSSDMDYSEIIKVIK
ncbi:MAG: hypothetical protein J6M24_01395 [Lachnospiraceae bacterium]|nr:hypothetical protein [Lachnospiraceae bacterium]